MTVSKIHEYLTFLIGPDRKNERAVAARVGRAIEKLQRDRGFTSRATMLRNYGIGGNWWRALSVKHGKIKERRLAQFLRKIKMPAEMLVNFDEPFQPWDAWKSGGRVAVVVGERQGVSRGDSLKSSLMGTRDCQAYDHLERVLRVEAGIVFQQELKTVPESGQFDAEAYLDDLCEQMKGGAIVVLGSPLRNPLADPIARRIARMPAAELPAHFRWPFEFGNGDHYLVDPTPCAPTQAGVRLRGHKSTTYKRVTDAQIIAKARARKKLGPKARLGPFADAAILAIDYDNDPMLILCAGHGGCATIAAVLGLGRLIHVDDCLDGSKDGIAVGRLWQPVIVNRYKATLALIDDMGFGENYGTDWDFPLDVFGKD